MVPPTIALFAVSSPDVCSSLQIPTSEVRQILEDSKLENEQIKATANDGKDVSQSLELAIKWWMTDSPLSFALDSVSLISRRQPVILVGGSFAIPAITAKIKQRLIDGGANESFILTPPNPEILSVQGMTSLFCNQATELKEVIHGISEDSGEQKTQLQCSAEISKSSEIDSRTAWNGTSLLASQSS